SPNTVPSRRTRRTSHGKGGSRGPGTRIGWPTPWAWQLTVATTVSFTSIDSVGPSLLIMCSSNGAVDDGALDRGAGNGDGGDKGDGGIAAEAVAEALTVAGAFSKACGDGAVAHALRTNIRDIHPCRKPPVPRD